MDKFEAQLISVNIAGGVTIVLECIRSDLNSKISRGINLKITHRVKQEVLNEVHDNIINKVCNVLLDMEG